MRVYFIIVIEKFWSWEEELFLGFVVLWMLLVYFGFLFFVGDLWGKRRSFLLISLGYLFGFLFL